MNKFKNKSIVLVAILVIILGIVIFNNKDDISKFIGVYTKENYDSISILTDGKSDETKTCINNKPNLIWALEYNDAVSSGTDGYCVTGTEDTCKASTCYMDKSVGSCEAGTIIKYQVNDDDVYYFNVLHDDGGVLTLQTTYNIPEKSSDFGSFYTGPYSVLNAIVELTSNWKNVNNLTYTLGKTVFLKYPNDSNNANPNTGCTSYNSCTFNIYTLTSNLTTNVKARIISIQEGADISIDGVFPNWFTKGEAFWTFNTTEGTRGACWYFTGNNLNNVSCGVSVGYRPVIEISK